MIVVPSETDETITYTIGIGAGGRPFCSCPAWKYNTEPDKKGRKICKHIRKHIKKLPRVRKIRCGSREWIRGRCSKCRAQRLTAEIFGMRCLRCNNQIKKGVVVYE